MLSEARKAEGSRTNALMFRSVKGRMRVHGQEYVGIRKENGANLWTRFHREQQKIKDQLSILTIAGMTGPSDVI